MKPTLYVFSGLPATGKTTLAAQMAAILKTAYLRLDTIEQGLRELCSCRVQGEGYRLAYRIAADNLRAGNDVIVDCVNPWELTRREWAEVALRSDACCVDIEVRCSDKGEHRGRAEARVADIAGFTLPTWQEIAARDYEEWTRDRMVVETAGRTIADCVAELIERTGTEGRARHHEAVETEGRPVGGP